MEERSLGCVRRSLPRADRTRKICELINRVVDRWPKNESQQNDGNGITTGRKGELNDRVHDKDIREIS